MAPQTGTALLVLAAFVLPGFVALMIGERTHLIKENAPTFDRLLYALYYSLLVYGLLLLFVLIVLGWHRHDVTDLAHGEKSLALIGTLALLTVLILPAVVATLGLFWMRSSWRPSVLQRLGISPTHRTPTAWDHFFAQEDEAMIRLTTRDGRVLGGYFGPMSFAGYGTERGGLFLEEQWNLDDYDWFESPVDESAGLWVPHDEIASFEVYNVRRG